MPRFNVEVLIIIVTSGAPGLHVVATRDNEQRLSHKSRLRFFRVSTETFRWPSIPYRSKSECQEKVVPAKAKQPAPLIIGDIDTDSLTH